MRLSLAFAVSVWLTGVCGIGVGFVIHSPLRTTPAGPNVAGSKRVSKVVGEAAERGESHRVLVLQVTLIMAQKGSSRGDHLKTIVAGAGAAMAASNAKAEEAALGPIMKYIDEIDKLNLRVPDFPKGLEWVNANPISFQRELRGKIVLCDFWCSCCISELPRLVVVCSRRRYEAPTS
jgi:hypothetical protein